jgi:hypothetical protein
MREVIDFFQKIGTQWIVSGMGGIIGLNYSSIIEIAKIYEFELNPYRMDLIRFIERYYIERSGDGSR